MLPVVAGRKATKRQILLYSLLLVPASLLPCVLGFAGALYGAIAVIWGALFVAIALRLSRMREGDAPVAQRLFVVSIAYLFLLFAALLLSGHGVGRAQADLSICERPCRASPGQGSAYMRTVCSLLADRRRGAQRAARVSSTEGPIAGRRTGDLFNSPPSRGDRHPHARATLGVAGGSARPTGGRATGGIFTYPAG